MPDPGMVARPPRGDRPTTRQVTCPTCRSKTAWLGNPQRPFCSLTCRLIDLGLWLDERYPIPPRTEDDVS